METEKYMRLMVNLQNEHNNIRKRNLDRSIRVWKEVQGLRNKITSCFKGGRTRTDQVVVRQALDDAQEEDLTQQLNRLNGDRTGMYLVPKLMYPQLVKKIIKHHQNISGVQDVMRLGCYSTHMAESVIAVLDEMVPLI